LQYIIPKVRDVTERKVAEAALQHRLEFETLVNSLSSHFIALAHEDLDTSIEQALAQIGTFLKVDRAYITVFNDPKTMSRTHEWCGANIAAYLEHMQELPTDRFSDWLNALHNKEPIHIDRVDDMPIESSTARQLLASQSVKSIVLVPLIQGVNLTGYLALDQVREAQRWDENDVRLLNVVAEIIASAQARKRASLSLKRSEERYRDLVENITDALFTIDTNGLITFISSVVESIMGYIPDELIGKHFSNFIYTEDIAKLDATFQRVLDQELDSVEFRIVTKLGRVRWVHSTSRPFEKDGRIIGIRGVISNIHARKTAEARELELQNQLETTAIQTATMLSRTIDEKDPYTAGHCKRLAHYANELGEQLGLSDNRLYNLKYAALLHDVGKIGVPEELLNKVDDLDPGEWERMKQHVNIGVALVSGIHPLKDSAVIISQHHEHWDGSGYPNHLNGEQILLEARILAVVDTFDAMTTDRPYRPAMVSAKVLEQLEKGAGKQWDPKVVHTFLAHFDKIIGAFPKRPEHSDRFEL
jgi:PAS domain S-box-containing protein/putative nucleotidyltransferase with HDIG domain